MRMVSSWPVCSSRPTIQDLPPGRAVGDGRILPCYPGESGVLRRSRGTANANGAPVALGYPIGASGARILVTLLVEIGLHGARLGTGTRCIGGSRPSRLPRR